MTRIHRTKERIKATGEVFTPLELVDEMLSKLPEEVWAPDKTFLEPSCGDGNFLVRIVAWKIWKAWEQWIERKKPDGDEIPRDIDEAVSIATVWQALRTIYAVDFQHDNVEHARERILIHAYLCRPAPAGGNIKSSRPAPMGYEKITPAIEQQVAEDADFKTFKAQYSHIVNRNIVFHNALTFNYDDWKATEIYDADGKVTGTIPQ